MTPFSATKAAVEEGIVVGGGSALLLANAKIKLSVTGDEAIGADIVTRALKAPLKQIAENADLTQVLLRTTSLQAHKQITL